MSKNELTTPVEIDTAIAEQSIKVEKAQRAVAIQTRYAERESYMFDQDKLDSAMRVLDDEFAILEDLKLLYTGWTRYYHVTNVNGHIHTSMNCSSCFADTEFAWRTDLSGLTVEEVVAKEAYNACTVCMPIAPAEQKAARQAYNKAERERKAAEKAAAKQAKELAKVPRAQALANKMNELYDAFGANIYGPGGAYEATYPGERFGKGYDNAFHAYADVIRDQERRAR